MRLSKIKQLIKRVLRAVSPASYFVCTSCGTLYHTDTHPNIHRTANGECCVCAALNGVTR